MTALDRDKLAKILGRLGSDQQGERDNAAAMASAMVRAAGVTWFDIIGTDNKSDSIETLIDRCLLHAERLTAWEAGFLKGIRGRSYLSQKQLDRLDEIIGKVGAKKAKAA